MFRKIESKNPKVKRTKNGRIMLLSKCTVFDCKKSEFIKQQVANGLSNSLANKSSFNENSL